MLPFLVLKKQYSGTLLLLRLFGLNHQTPISHLSPPNLLGHTQAGTQHWWATVTAEATAAAEEELSPCKDGRCDPHSKGAAAFSSCTAKVLLKP